jgi:hypothetical protein
MTSQGQDLLTQEVLGLRRRTPDCAWIFAQEHPDGMLESRSVEGVHMRLLHLGMQ